MIIRQRNIFIYDKGERRDLNPRKMESQPIALTTWLHPPIYKYIYQNWKNSRYDVYLRLLVTLSDF